MKQLDGRALYYGFVAGANAVVEQKDMLNRINVFPIADGDTGSNLVFTMRAIVDEATIAETTKATLESISEAALVGARGNSGIIFAQFVRGFSTAIGDVKDISVQDFAAAVKKAVPYAYEAVANPTEGTILTLMEDWANSLTYLHGRAKDFEELFSQSLDTALTSLEDTPNKLQVLKRAAVVDSGAKGFFHFLEGFYNFVKDGRALAAVEADEAFEFDLDETYAAVDEDIAHRYCTEALITGNGLSTDAIKDSLQDLGDSLIVAGGDTKVRVHMHTNQPETLMLRLRKAGTITQQKVDDMQRQSDVIHRRQSSVALVTDSIADIPQKIVDQQQIHMVPLNVMMEGSAYVDRLTITSGTIYTLLDAMDEYPTSSQPNARSVEQVFSFLSKHYDSIIVLSVSQGLSGTFSTFVNAAKRFQEQGARIDVIDSKLNSGAQGLVAVKAAEAIAEGRNHDEVMARIEEWIAKSKIYVSVHTLKYMLRSGRISSTLAVAAKLLNLKPVVSLDEKGKGSIFGKAFSTKGNTRLIRKTVQAIFQQQGIADYCVVHASAPERAQEYARIFTEMTGREPKYIMDVSAITALSAGIGSTGIALITE